MDFLTTAEMSEIWDISTRRISLLCSEGRVEGAVKKGKTWLIPQNVKKPEDPRRVRKNGQTK
ncbi:MAG: DNA-binding protein [Lachnospiraceae bacterium]